LKAIYKFNDNKVFIGSDTVDDDYQVGTNETEVKPEDGLYEPVTWNGTTWLGTDQAIWQAAQDAKQSEILKEHPELAPQPSAMDTALANLSAMVLQNQQQTQAQLAAIASTVLKNQVANTTNGGNI
jgi:hypothetical protein